MSIAALLLVALIGTIIRSPLPANTLDLDNWALAIPVAPAAEIKQPALSTYRSQYLDVNYLGNGVKFTTPTNGAIQPGSDYPRTELRQTETWNSDTGTHKLEITESINILPAGYPSAIIAQIHDADRYIAVTQINGPKIYIKIADTEAAVLDDNYTRGQIFTMTWTVSNNQLTVQYNTRPPAVIPIRCAGCYYKAGVYDQQVTDTPGDVAQATIYELKVRNLK